ncbi:hypothetical protein PAMP_019332 [Pampus punctatissimus]
MFVCRGRRRKKQGGGPDTDYQSTEGHISFGGGPSNGTQLVTSEEHIFLSVLVAVELEVWRHETCMRWHSTSIPEYVDWKREEVCQEWGRIRGAEREGKGKTGGLRVHKRQKKQKEKEVLGDLIIRLSSKCYISNISAWK